MTASYGAFWTHRDSGAAPVTGLFCMNDSQALRVLQILWRLGLHVPQDISVVGFDDESASTSAIPPLTTVACDTTRAGRAAAELLVERMRSPRRTAQGGDLGCAADRTGIDRRPFGGDPTGSLVFWGFVL